MPQFRRMRRRFTRGRRRGRPLWARATVGATLDTTLRAIILADPTVLPGGASGFDYRRTVLRIRLLLQYNLQASFTVGVPSSSVIQCGISLASVGEPIRDPGMTLATDRATDWLDLWSVQTAHNNPPATATGFSPPVGVSEFFFRDVRVKRKVDADQVVLMSYKASNLASGSPMAGTILLSVSTLWTSQVT